MHGLQIFFSEFHRKIPNFLLKCVHDTRLCKKYVINSTCSLKLLNELNHRIQSNVGMSLEIVPTTDELTVHPAANKRKPYPFMHYAVILKNPGVYRGSKEIDIAIIWPSCFYMAIFEREKISTAQLIEKTLFWMILIL